MLSTLCSGSLFGPDTVARGGAAARKGDGSAPDSAGQSGKRASRSAQALDSLIHQRTRLAIVSALAVSDSLTFTELKRLVKTTDGNLSVHSQKLEEAGYISCNKSFEGRTPVTRFALSDLGRRTFDAYRDHMEALIRTTREQQ